MFDTAKIQRMTALLEKIPSEFDDVYLIPERRFFAEAVALFKRLKIPIRGIMYDTTPQKEIWGFPVVKTAEVSSKFNERTALIIIVEKPVPFIQTTFDFKVRGRVWTIPAFVMTSDESFIVYDYLMMKKFIQMHLEDGISDHQKNLNTLVKRFARGLTVMLNPNHQKISYSLWDNHNYFKPTYDFDDTAIVIQGPIAYENNYTAETFKIYRSIYPNVPIIVSTWKGEATNNFCRECKENSIVLLENEIPEKCGPSNVNLQLKSSFQGVKYVQENTSANFVLKTRTDQRINRFDFLVYFKNLLKTFPPKDDKLRQRIIFLGVNELNQFPFYYQDYLSFGHIEDISKLYGISFHNDPGEMSYHSRHYARMRKFVDNVLCKPYPLDYNSLSTQNLKSCKLKRWARRLCLPEIYISRTFYKENIAPIDEKKLPETSWMFAKDYLILIDPEAILIDWPKYKNRRYQILKNPGSQSAFSRWLDMYRNFKMDWV